MSKSKTGKDKLSATEARLKCLEFKRMGLSFRAIGKQLGISGTAAYNHVKRALKDLNKQSSEVAADYRALQLERLESLLVPLQARIGKGDVSAISQANRIVDSITRLMGADAPTKVAQTTPDGTEPYDPFKSMTADERKKRIAELEQKVKRKK